MRKFLTMFIAGVFIMSIALFAQTTPPVTPAGNKKAAKEASSKPAVKKETGNTPVKKVTSKKHKDSLVKPVEKKTQPAPSKIPEKK